MPRSLLRCLVFAASALYFAWGLSRREINVLEAQDFGIACDLFRSYGLTPDHSPLHFVFVNLWQRLDASSVAFLRLPSVVFSALAVVVVWSLAERIAGSRAGLAAAALFATNPLVVDNARSMRMYGLALLASASMMWLAHAYLVVARRRRYLAGLALTMVVAVYNHLFAWLLVGSIGAIFVFGRWNFAPAERRHLLRWAAGTTAVLLPQIIHVFAAIGFVHERHTLYRGLDAGRWSFLAEIGRTLFLGEEPSPLGVYVILAPLALVVVGIVALRRIGARAAAALFLPALAIAWALSLSNPIEARYLNYLVPALAIFMAVGLRGWAWAGAVVVIGLSCHATHAGGDVAPTDWYAGVQRIAAERKPGDVVAIFPDFWQPAFRRYGDLGEAAAVAFPADLDRVLAEKKRVLLVALPGREPGSIDALMHAHARVERLFRTTLRETFAVYSLVSNEAVASPGVFRDSLLLTGVVGSGGYAWQSSETPRPFAGLSALFADRLVIAGYEPYHPPWAARLALGGTATELLRPNPIVAGALADAGVKAVVAVCDDDDACPGAAGLAIVPREGEPRVDVVGGTKVATVALAHPDRDGERAIGRARTAAGKEGRVVVFVPAVRDYGRLATTSERAIAHRLVELGADVVAGMGGYAAKEVETYEDGLIAYSLGALLRAPGLSAAKEDSSSIALDVAFPVAGPPRFEVVPVTFDDRDRPALGRAGSARRLVVRDDPESLADRLATADAFVEGGRDLGPWRDATCLVPKTGLSAEAARLAAWFPLAAPTTPLRPVAGFFGGFGDAYVARRGVLELGELHRAVELDPAGVASVAVRFPDVPMTGTLALAFGLPDDRLRSKYAPLRDQNVTVAIGDRVVLSESLPYRIGFRRMAIDTRDVASTRRAITVTVRSNGTHFPVALAASTVSSDP